MSNQMAAFVKEALVGKVDPIFNLPITKDRAEMIVSSLMGKTLGDSFDFVSLSVQPDTQEQVAASVPAYPLNTYSDGYKAAMEDGKPVEVATLRTLTHILNNRIEALEAYVDEQKAKSADKE